MEKIAVNFHEGLAPVYGEMIYDQQFPSEMALIPPVIIRLVEHLDKEGLTYNQSKTQLNLCLDEAIKNAVLHGNGTDSSKRLSIRVYLAEESFWVVISDQGEGFDPKSIPDPLDEIGILKERGRGLYLIQHYTKKVEFWNGGRTIALCFSCLSSED